MVGANGPGGETPPKPPNPEKGMIARWTGATYGAESGMVQKRGQAPRRNPFSGS